MSYFDPPDEPNPSEPTPGGPAPGDPSPGAWQPPPVPGPGFGAPQTPPPGPPFGDPSAPTPPGQPPGGFQQPAAPGGYPPPGGGYAPSGYGMGYQAQVEHPQGTTILVLGILSVVCCQILGPVAWIMGNNALKEIDARPGYYSNRGTVQAGRIIGIVMSVFLILAILGYGLLFILAAASTSDGY